MCAEQAQRPPDAFLRCDYDEFDPFSYRGVILEVYPDGFGKGESTESLFNSGHPMRDKNEAIEQARHLNAKLSVTSSWDNFMSDALNEIVGQGRMHHPDFQSPDGQNTGPPRWGKLSEQERWLRIQISKINSTLLDMKNDLYFALHPESQAPSSASAETKYCKCNHCQGDNSN